MLSSHVAVRSLRPVYLALEHPGRLGPLAFACDLQGYSTARKARPAHFCFEPRCTPTPCLRRCCAVRGSENQAREQLAADIEASGHGSGLATLCRYSLSTLTICLHTRRAAATHINGADCPAVFHYWKLETLPKGCFESNVGEASSPAFQCTVAAQPESRLQVALHD